MRGLGWTFRRTGHEQRRFFASGFPAFLEREKKEKRGVSSLPFSLPVSPLNPLSPLGGPPALASRWLAGEGVVQKPNIRGSKTEYPWFKNRISVVQKPNAFFSSMKSTCYSFSWSGFGQSPVGSFKNYNILGYKFAFFRQDSVRDEFVDCVLDLTSGFSPWLFAVHVQGVAQREIMALENRVFSVRLDETIEGLGDDSMQFDALGDVVESHRAGHVGFVKKWVDGGRQLFFVVIPVCPGQHGGHVCFAGRSLFSRLRFSARDLHIESGHGQTLQGGQKSRVVRFSRSVMSEQAEQGQGWPPVGVGFSVFDLGCLPVLALVVDDGQQNHEDVFLVGGQLGAGVADFSPAGAGDQVVFQILPLAGIPDIHRKKWAAPGHVRWVAHPGRQAVLLLLGRALEDVLPDVPGLIAGLGSDALFHAPARQPGAAGRAVGFQGPDQGRERGFQLRAFFRG
jgi:hypothetical protein